MAAKGELLKRAVWRNLRARQSLARGMDAGVTSWLDAMKEAQAFLNGGKDALYDLEGAERSLFPYTPPPAPPTKAKLKQVREEEMRSLALRGMQLDHVKLQLRKLPHPTKVLAARGKTRLDWAQFRMVRGSSEWVEVGRFLERHPEWMKPCDPPKDVPR